MSLPDPQADTTPSGWQLVTLKGGLQHGHRFTIHDSDDKLTLIDDDGEAHDYFRLNHRAELHHQSVIDGAMRKRGK
jgi:hypothetical protein